MDSFEFKKQWEIGERPDWAAALPFDWGGNFQKILPNFKNVDMK